jgi:hypothetical protein
MGIASPKFVVIMGLGVLADTGACAYLTSYLHGGTLEDVVYMEGWIMGTFVLGVLGGIVARRLS